MPEIVANPRAGFVWTNPCKVLALWGGTFLLATLRPGTASGEPPDTRRSAGCLPAPGAAFLGVFLLVCGVQHFVYADFVLTLVPAWMPPGRLFWTYFAGVALMAGGCGILLPATRWWAGGLSGLMILSWVPLLHLPRALANLHDAGETAAVFEALALSGVAFLVAGDAARRTR